jgi:hypothetical protein
MANLTGYKAQPDDRIKFLKLNLNFSGYGQAHDMILSFKIDNEFALESHHHVS